MTAQAIVLRSCVDAATVGRGGKADSLDRHVDVSHSYTLRSPLCLAVSDGPPPVLLRPRHENAVSSWCNARQARRGWQLPVEGTTEGGSCSIDDLRLVESFAGWSLEQVRGREMSNSRNSTNESSGRGGREGVDGSRSTCIDSDPTFKARRAFRSAVCVIECGRVRLNVPPFHDELSVSSPTPTIPTRLARKPWLLRPQSHLTFDPNPPSAPQYAGQSALGGRRLPILERVCLMLRMMHTSNERLAGQPERNKLMRRKASSHHFFGSGRCSAREP